jgi:hypothetical protein
MDTSPTGDANGFSSCSIVKRNECEREERPLKIRMKDFRRYSQILWNCGETEAFCEEGRTNLDFLVHRKLGFQKRRFFSFRHFAKFCFSPKLCWAIIVSKGVKSWQTRSGEKERRKGKKKEEESNKKNAETAVRETSVDVGKTK